MNHDKNTYFTALTTCFGLADLTKTYDFQHAYSGGWTDGKIPGGPIVV